MKTQHVCSKVAFRVRKILHLKNNGMCPLGLVCASRWGQTGASEMRSGAGFSHLSQQDFFVRAPYSSSLLRQTGWVWGPYKEKMDGWWIPEHVTWKHVLFIWILLWRKQHLLSIGIFLWRTHVLFIGTFLRTTCSFHRHVPMKNIYASRE